MEPLTLQQEDVPQGEQQQATCGKSLSSNYAPPNLENKLLFQASSLMPCSPLLNFLAQPPSCPSLQPSSLTSTTSSLLSTSSRSPSLTSPLLSTENKLLKSRSPLSTSLNAVPNDSLLSTSLASNTLLKSFSQPSSSLHPDLGGEQKRDDGGDKDESETSEAVESYFEETSVTHSEEDDSFSEEEMEEDAGPTVEQPVHETELGVTELELPVRQEEFAEIDRGDDPVKEKLKDKKYLLLNEVCCSLVNKSTAPGQKDWDAEKSVWTRIMKLAKEISASDPEFLLKVAVYTRQQLNIRITANFLLALAANQPSTKPHLRRYFHAAIQLPSDWLEVVRIYSTCFSCSLPTCLKKAMADKFKDFSEYQLAKYNTRKHRCKHNRNICESKKPNAEKIKNWADLLRSDADVLTKFLQENRVVEVDKKQSEFSLKKMIKRLHIKEPAEYVMAILGKKYPASQRTFTHSGMKGTWDQERAGQRMKLKEPETWERLLSREGNKASTWEKLIDNKSLPFMAMLRNLRNMITKGISEAHHKKILSKLTNKKAIIQSRQFPIRFLAAYKVIMELDSLASASEQAVPPVKDILNDILKKFRKSKRFFRLNWDSTPSRRIRATLRVPFVYQLYRKKKAKLVKKNASSQYTVALLDRYRKALETAVQISCRYNLCPLPGRTVILLTSDIDINEPSKYEICLPPDPEQNKDGEEDGEDYQGRERNKNNDGKLTPTTQEVAALLSLMIGSSAEDFELYKTDWDFCIKLEVTSDVLLENVRSVVKQLQKCHESKVEGVPLPNLLAKKNKVDNIILICDYWLYHRGMLDINKYRKDVNNKALVVNIYLSSERCRDPDYTNDKNCVNLIGFNEQMLRFVAERGSSRLLDHVEHLDQVYNIPPAEGDKGPQPTNSVVSITATPDLRWRGVRVFISSTFRDMNAERDILVHRVFPELRRRAASHCLYLQEVELRWGVTEEESGRAAELCLSEVCRSQMLVGILGERYGVVPPKPVLPDLPEYKWLASAPAGMSITEMEMCQFKALYPDTAHKRMFCYFRDPNIIKSIPVAWRSHFAAESKEAESKMASLKNWLRSSKVKVTENYQCEWGGAVDGKPYLKNLEDFGRAVLEDLWTAVVQQFVEDADEAMAVSNMSEQEVHQGALQRQFFGRTKQLVKAVEMVELTQTKGRMMVVEGAPGEGKTVFMAALADALRTGTKSRTNFVCDVISYSTAASQSACYVENLLQCLIQWLRKIKETEEELPVPQSYKDLLSEFRSMLSDIKMKKPLVMFVDGVDLVKDSKGQLSSDWIPQQLPKGVCLVISMTSKTTLLQTLAKKKSTLLFTLGQLTMMDRRDIVQKGLDTFGKKLSDSAFNNQLQTLIMKGGAVSPLYLHLACEDLRRFASFDKLKESLQGLPQSLSQLVEHSLDRLCSQHRGLLGLRWALAALTVSPTGLREGHLYSVLNTCNDLSSQDGKLLWQEALQLSRKPKGRIPMATFTHIVQSLTSLIGLFHCHNTEDVLIITNPEVRKAFEDFLLSSELDRNRAHLVLAAHLWAVADQQGTDTFLYCEANSVKHLPSSLIQSGQLEALHHLLSSFYFLYANVRHGLLHHLLETYSLFDNKYKSTLSCDSHACLQDCWSFLQRHALLLSSWPNLCIQQALNEPRETSAYTWAHGLVRKGGVRAVEWLNNDHQHHEETSKLLSTFSSEPTCLVVSSDEQLMVVGTGQGMLHVINTQSGQEIKSLVSSCDGISSSVFLKDGRLLTTSFDGQIETWDLENGYRTNVVDAHTNAIMANDITEDGKHLATVSLDSMLKVWSSAKGQEVATLLSPGPLNCVRFDPDDHLLAAGCWNGNVIVWNWLRNKTQTSLSGHKSSVRSLCFSSSSMLCSGSVSGEIRVWSVSTSSCVGCFQAHAGATEALTFLGEKSMLLSAGSDHMLQLWSGGLGRSVKAFKTDKCEQEPHLKKQKSTTSVPAALCVAVHGDYVAVGYHGDGIKLFRLDTAEKIWTPEHLDVSVLSLKWVALNPEQPEEKVLMSAGSDKRVRVWKRKEGEEGMLGALEMIGLFGAQPGVVLAMEQNSTYLATASESCSIALWKLSEIAEDICSEPHDILRGHSGGVTCLAFSPDGGRLLSGGKDQALMVWEVSVSPAVVSKSLPHSHRDWITGCVWTPDCVISSSNDGRLCLWDLEAGQRLQEISWNSPLTSVCCLGQYVIAGCAEGALHVWMWETSVEICHIAAHKQRVHHCSLLPNPDKKEEMTVFTASDDGTVQLWKPLEVENFNTFTGHSGAICGVVCKEGVQEFLTVSEDCSLRCWTWSTDNTHTHKGPVSALCFSQSDDLFLAGYDSGLIEIWQHNTVVGHKQTSNSSITAICSMPDNQFAVSYVKLVVDVFKLVWNQRHSAASLVRVNAYRVEELVVCFNYCSVLIGVTQSGNIIQIPPHEEEEWGQAINRWNHYVRILGLIPNDEKSMWLVGEEDDKVYIGFIFAMGPTCISISTFSDMHLKADNDDKEMEVLSALTINKDLVVCGDVQGNMWFIQSTDPSIWSNRKYAHSDMISVLRLTEQTIISASYDRTVKLWDRNTKKQVGMFVCRGPVVHLEVNPNRPTELVCSDRQGQIYVLSWKEQS